MDKNFVQYTRHGNQWRKTMNDLLREHRSDVKEVVSWACRRSGPFTLAEMHTALHDKVQHEPSSLLSEMKQAGMVHEVGKEARGSSQCRLNMRNQDTEDLLYEAELLPGMDKRARITRELGEDIRGMHQEWSAKPNPPPISGVQLAGIVCRLLRLEPDSVHPRVVAECFREVITHKPGFFRIGQERPFSVITCPRPSPVQDPAPDDSLPGKPDDPPPDKPSGGVFTTGPDDAKYAELAADIAFRKEVVAWIASVFGDKWFHAADFMERIQSESHWSKANGQGVGRFLADLTNRGVLQKQGEKPKRVYRLSDGSSPPPPSPPPTPERKPASPPPPATDGTDASVEEATSDATMEDLVLLVTRNDAVWRPVSLAVELARKVAKQSGDPEMLRAVLGEVIAHLEEIVNAPSKKGVSK